jgi:conjugative relaxase-like TrwC/TraI family protein
MLSHKVLTRQDVSRAASYYEDGADDYYAKEGEGSAWQGQGADALGLVGPVDSERLRELLAGHVPGHGSTSRVSTRQDANSQIGIDLTFSAPKSVSLQALVGGDPAIVRAHDLAVERAIAVAEERAQARKKIHGRSQVEDTRNLVVAKFRHETSRERDPQLHTHALVLNLTMRSDGEWRALRNDGIVKTTRYLGAVYRAELAAELQRAGHSLRHGRDGFFELAHIDRAQLAAFSRRAERIEGRLAEAGLTRETASSVETQRAALATRSRKVSADRQATYADWRARAVELGIEFTRPETGMGRDGATFDASPSTGAGGSPQTAAEGARQGVRFAIAHLTERQAIIEEHELFDVALKHAVGRARLRHIEREVERQTASGYLIRESPLYRAADAPTGSQARSRGAWASVLTDQCVERQAARERVEEAIREGRLVPAERRYTTQTALEHEKRILQIEREGRGQVSPMVSASEVRRQLEAARLTTGQREAVELIASTSNRIVGVQGHAGTGKSHMLDRAKTVVEEQGYKIVALAPYATQVRTLRDLGVEARTLASFLAAREKKVDARTVLVIDEAGTVPTRQMEQALKLVERADARVVLLGDTQQTKAIEAGRPFDQLQSAGMQTASMQEIQRQKDATLRKAVALAAKGEAAKSLALIRDVCEIRDDHYRRLTIAKDYARMPAEERERTIVVAGTNGARREINRAVRKDLGLDGWGRDHTILVRRDTTQAERAFAKNYAPGNVIQPERDYRSVGLERGTLYEVTESGPGNRLTVRSEAGETIEFSPMTCRKLSVYEPERAELAVGDRVRITRNDAALDVANGDRFTVAAVSPRAVTLTDGGREVELPAGRPLHLDHAYATTVHSSQGLTADRVLFDASTRSRTTSKDVFYVAISRARQEAHVYTDDRARLPMAVERKHRKEAAMDLERG